MTQRLALVTGASRGLGAAIAEQLALRGWHVVAVARTVGGLEDLDDRVKAAGLPGAGALTLAPMDVTNDDAMRHLCRSIHDRWGGLGLWVHAAIHAAPLAPAGHLDQKDWEKSLATNTRATGMLIPMVEPLLLAHQGTALFLDDLRAGQPFFGAYGATKAAQMALARSWQAETARHGPRVLIAAPAGLPTATRARFFPGEDRTRLADVQAEAARILDAL
ncbi:SDR family oxidoreductase [Tabrizicola sp.]|jgi:NAD(P)-dependent dehydrogenase (short-subunit alcohol dehydrogenase family)|uniref:SDR family NAD(P)-dependent oxidoreductase n=1 Tax=Tabrizicola sp. TaxID=2005166 RepID=UPI0025D8CC24|nr:SDR family oxidoreductase [Tabrizicola sp.]MBY0352116.1 SDR family oxidoreductase [Tabrizicola sp.]MDK2774974.1 SDR family oxidoreductase [Tabrizicola sp.]